MKPFPLRSLIVAISCIGAIACDQNGNSLVPGVAPITSPTTTPNPVTVRIQPQTVEAVPGETSQFTATVTGSSTTGVVTSWDSTGLPVLSLQGQPAGLSAGVKCESLGSGTVRVAVGDPKAPTSVDQAQVTCIDPVRLSTSLTAVHILGYSACPQVIGNIVLTNVSGRAVSVTARSENKVIEVTPGETSVPAQAAQSFSVVFTCGSSTPVVSRIIFTVSVGGVQLTYASDVVVNRG